MNNTASEVKALHDLAEHVLMAWLAVESPTDRRRQKAIELLADAGQLLHSACVNLGAFSQYDEAG